MDLKTLSALDVIPSSWSNKEQAKEFKEKVFRLLLKRQGFSDEMISTKKTFQSSLVDIKSFHYAAVSGYCEASIRSINQLLKGVSVESVYIAVHFIWDGVMEYNGELYEGYEECIDSILEELKDPYMYEEFDEVFLDKEALMSAAKAYDAIHLGNFETALDNPYVEDMIDGLVELFSDCNTEKQIITSEFVMMHLGDFFELFDMNECYHRSINVISSEEIYKYRSYKHLLPKAIRDTADIMISIVENPYPVIDTISVDTEYNDELKMFTILLNIAEEWEYGPDRVLEESDMSGLWYTAFSWLDENLPKLSMQYAQPVCAAAC